jgi:hypothetical protein
MLEKLDLQVKGSLPTLLSVKNEKLHMRVIVLNIYPSSMVFWAVKNILEFQIWFLLGNSSWKFFF